jgi:hypothetical protein
MPRSTMADLITLVRTETNAATSDFSDDLVQGFLDRHRKDIFLAYLCPETTYVSGQAVYKDYFAGVDAWEADAILIDGNGATVAAGVNDTFGYLQGRFTFNTGRTDSLRITGKTYDIHLAAAELLDAWAAKLTLDFDFETDGQKFSRSQKAKALGELGKAQRRQARVGSGRLLRTDECPDRADATPSVYASRTP